MMARLSVCLIMALVGALVFLAGCNSGEEGVKSGDDPNSAAVANTDVSNLPGASERGDVGGNRGGTTMAPGAGRAPVAEGGDLIPPKTGN